MFIIVPGGAVAPHRTSSVSLGRGQVPSDRGLLRYVIQSEAPPVPRGEKTKDVIADALSPSESRTRLDGPRAVVRVSRIRSEGERLDAILRMSA